MNIEIESYKATIHALKEYKEWRNNRFIGQNLGPEREIYVALLRKRARKAIANYKKVRAKHFAPDSHKAA